MASDRPSVSDQPERKIEVAMNLAGGGTDPGLFVSLANSLKTAQLAH